MTTREQWTIPDIAAHLGVGVSTVTSWRSRGRLPDEDGQMGRTPWWWADTIRTWHERRPGRGRKAS